MGLAKDIAIKGGGAIAAVLLVAYLASKTKILDKVREGLSSTGRAVGQGVGAGLAGIPIGVGEGAAKVFQEGAGELGTAFKGFTDWLSGIGNPQQAYGQTAESVATTSPPLTYGPPTPENTTITPAIREYSDEAARTYISSSPNVPFFAKPSPGTKITKVVTSGGKITSVTRHVSSAAVVKAASPARQAHFAKVKAKAVARAKKKGRKCFNSEVDFGGANHILFRHDLQEVGYAI